MLRIQYIYENNTNTKFYFEELSHISTLDVLHYALSFVTEKLCGRRRREQIFFKVFNAENKIKGQNKLFSVLFHWQYQF